MSDKLTSFGIYGYDSPSTAKAKTAQVASQMIWYFLEGFFNRKKDYPVSTAGLVVEFRQLNSLPSGKVSKPVAGGCRCLCRLEKNTNGTASYLVLIRTIRRPAARNYPND